MLFLVLGALHLSLGRATRLVTPGGNFKDLSKFWEQRGGKTAEVSSETKASTPVAPASASAGVKSEHKKAPPKPQKKAKKTKARSISAATSAAESVVSVTSDASVFVLPQALPARADSPFETRMVDFTMQMGGEQQITFEDGATYRCCCKDVAKMLNCELRDVTVRVRMTGNGCGSLWEDSHSYTNTNLFSADLPHVGKCYVKESTLPDVALTSLYLGNLLDSKKAWWGNDGLEPHLRDVTALFRSGHRTAILDNRPYVCCCKAQQMDIFCHLHQTKEACGKVAGQGFHSYLRKTLQKSTSHKAGRCIVPLSELPATTWKLFT